MNKIDIFLELIAIAFVPAAFSLLLYILRDTPFFKKMSYRQNQIFIGLVFGAIAVFGTEFGVNVEGATINVRDAAPLCAGLIFGAPAGILAGVIGGVERWFAVLWGAGMYSRLACSISTMLAGLYAAFLRRYLFDDKRPTWGMALMTGVVMEVVHMTILFLTHISDAEQAFAIVKLSTLPMVACNALSLAVAVIAINTISRKRRIHSSHVKKISQKIQTWLLILVVLSFAFTTVFTFRLQTETSMHSAEQMMKIYIDDVKNEIKETSDSNLLNITRRIANDLNAHPDAKLDSLLEKYDVTEINLVGRDNIIVDSTCPEFINYDMNSGEQSAYFSALNKGKYSLVQPYQQISFTENGIQSRKYAGVILSRGGYVQVGYDAASFQSDILDTVKDITRNRHIGEGGFMMVTDSDFFIVSNLPMHGDLKLITTGVKIKSDTAIRENQNSLVYGTDCYWMYDITEGYYIIAVMPHSEVFEARDTETYINSYMQIIVFALLFILIYFLIKRLVVDNIRSVNRSLSKIIGGNLDVVIDVRSSDEFSSLSDDINSTVSTLKHYISAAAARIDEELEFAKKIQLSTLPTNFPAYPDINEFDIHAYMCTAKEVGGDFYDFYMLGEDKLAFLVADVSGKGIPAAMFMMTAKSIIRSCADTGMPVNDILTSANEKLCQENDAEMFVTAWMGILDIRSGKLCFANAGHNPPLIYRKDGSFEYLRSRPGFVLAGMEGVRYKLQETTLGAGDKLFLYTDGVTEATDLNKELYGEDRLAAHLNGNIELSPSEIIVSLKSDIDRFVGEAEQFDDITMLALSYAGPEDESFIEKCFAAELDTYPEVAAFVEETLEGIGCPMKALMQLGIAVEEIFVNVAHYAYPEGKGDCLVGIAGDEDSVSVRFTDAGIPFDPLKKPDPDVTLSVQDRQIGGLGIYMVKKTMDDVYYEYKDGKNVLTLRKKIR